MREHLDLYGQPRPRSWTASIPLALLIGACVMTLFTDHILTALLPWVIVASVVLYMGQRVRQLKRLQAQVTHVQDLTMLRYQDSALQAAWPLLPKTALMPQMQGQVIACMAYNLDRLGAYDAASLTYHFLMDRLPPEHPGRYQLQLQQTQAWLLNDELASADTAIRQLRGGIENLADASMDAAYCFVQLLQQVRTHHFAEAIEKAPTLLEDLRPLGIDAGYGHGLMALCFFQIAQRNEPQRMADATTWWTRATHLLSPQVLSQRFTELTDLDTQLSTPPAPGSFPLDHPQASGSPAPENTPGMILEASLGEVSELFPENIPPSPPPTSNDSEVDA